MGKVVRIGNTYSISTKTVLARKRLCVTLNVKSLVCWYHCVSFVFQTHTKLFYWIKLTEGCCEVIAVKKHNYKYMAK